LELALRAFSIKFRNCPFRRPRLRFIGTAPREVVLQTKIGTVPREVVLQTRIGTVPEEIVLRTRMGTVPG
jgi:mRNA-degrading endonuclease toxin of MazEF toxin-antitoxin module